MVWPLHISSLASTGLALQPFRTDRARAVVPDPDFSAYFEHGQYRSGPRIKSGVTVWNPLWGEWLICILVCSGSYIKDGATQVSVLCNLR
jgi:hypothetical protein